MTPQFCEKQTLRSGDDSFSDTDKGLVMLWYKLWKSLSYVALQMLCRKKDDDGCLEEFEDMENDFDI
ncbi:MAG: hypothetical protein MHM6MM_004130 [Cercozoa sp. M6MM]